MPFLPAVALDFADGQPEDAELFDGFLHLVEGERFDDGGDQFHGSDLRWSGCWWQYPGLGMTAQAEAAAALRG